MQVKGEVKVANRKTKVNSIFLYQYKTLDIKMDL
jgi:hypothetical protein